MATRYLDNIAGSDAEDATSFANRVRSITSGLTSARVAATDSCRLAASIRGSLSGVSITKGDYKMTVPAGNHKILNACDVTAAWTARTYITVATSTTRMLGANSISITPATAFTTGEAAYVDLGSSTDLSAFSAIFILIRAGGAMTSQLVSLNLYSDSGTTLIKNIAPIAQPVTPLLSNSWGRLVFSDGMALPNNVRAIGINVGVDPGTTAVLIDNLVACHDPRVTPNSIGPQSVFSTSSDLDQIFGWQYDVGLCGVGMFVDDTTIELPFKRDRTAPSTTNYLWPHATVTDGTVQVWHGWPDPRGTSTSASAITFQRSGATYDALVEYHGGYNRTDMTTQDADGLTVFWNDTMVGRGIVVPNNVSVSRCVFLDSGGIYTIGTNVVHSQVAYVGCGYTANAIVNSGQAWRVEFDGLLVDTSTGNTVILAVVEGGSLRNFKHYNGGDAVILSADSADSIAGIRVGYSVNYGIYARGSARGYVWRDLYLHDNPSGDISMRLASIDVRMRNATLASTVKMICNTPADGITGGRCIIQGVDGDADAVLGVSLGQTLTRDTTVVDGTAAASMKILIDRNVFNPRWSTGFQLARRLALVGGVPTAAITGKTVTCSVRYRRTSTNLSGTFGVKPGPIIVAGATDNLNATADTWATATVSFVAAADGVVAICFELWSSDAVSSIYYNPESISITAV